MNTYEQFLNEGVLDDDFDKLFGEIKKRFSDPKTILTEIGNPNDRNIIGRSAYEYKFGRKKVKVTRKLDLGFFTPDVKYTLEIDDKKLVNKISKRKLRKLYYWFKIQRDKDLFDLTDVDKPELTDPSDPFHEEDWKEFEKK